MAKVAANARLWTPVAAFVAPVGTTAPTDPTAAPASGWTDVGWSDDSGMTAGRAQNIIDLRGPDGSFLRRSRNQDDRTFTMTLVETNAAVYGLVNPGSAIASTGTAPNKITTVSVRSTVGQRDLRAFLFDFVDGALHLRRIIPTGEVVNVPDIVYSSSAYTVYGLTIQPYPASDLTTYIDITDDQALAA